MMNGVQTPDGAPSPEAILAAFGIGGGATAMTGSRSTSAGRLALNLPGRPKRRLAGRLVPGLLARLPHELEISRRADEFLAA
jgi:hypothetical protein